MIYLGKCPEKAEYFFFATKAGMGRFIKYASYPFWCKSSNVPDQIDISSTVSDEVVEEVRSFVSGKLQIEVIPKSRGRKEKVVRTLTEVKTVRGNTHERENKGTEEIIDQPVDLASHDSRRRVSSNKEASGKCTGTSTVPRRSPVPEPAQASIPVVVAQKQKRHRRTKKEMEEARLSASKEVPPPTVKRKRNAHE